MTNADHKERLATSKTKNLIVVFYFLFLLFMGFYAFKKPTYGWDTLPYMGVVLSYDSNNINFIHDTVYEIAKQQMPVEVYKQLTDSSIPYRKRMATNAFAFNSQFPFYVVKPLYTSMVYLFYKSGFSLLKAAVLPSVIAYFLMGCLVFLWLKPYLQTYFSVIASLLIMLLAPVLKVLKGCSPDCLASFLLLAGFYFIIEKKSLLIAFLFLLLSAFARIENVIPCFFILSLIACTNKWKERIHFKKYFLMLTALIICYLLITSGTLKYGWGLLYYSSYTKHFNEPYSAPVVSSVKDYLILFYTHIVIGFFFSNVVLFMLLALIVFTGKGSFQFKQLSFEQLFILVIILCIVTRYFFQPLIDDRFYIAYYLCVIILLIKKYDRLFTSKKLVLQ